MKRDSELRISNWVPNNGSSFQFMRDTFIKCLERVTEAISYAWIREQILRFKLNRLGSVGTYDLVVQPIHAALIKSNYKDLFFNGQIHRISFQIQESMFLTLYRDTPHLKYIATYTKQTGPTFKSTTITFELHPNGFGNIISTNIKYAYPNSATVGGGLLNAEVSINHIVDLLLQNTSVTFLKVVAIDAGAMPKSETENSL